MIPIAKPNIGKEEKEAVLRVLDTGMIAQGPVVLQLEKEFCKLTKAKYAIALTNGTAALHTALYAAGIKRGDEVITTPFTFVATANAILMIGATPVFVDIDKETYNISPRDIELAITRKTRAIIAVDLYGQPAEYSKIKKIANKHKLIVIEDAAQSIGATYNGMASGNLSDIGCFSLYATKNITCGEGGMITTNNQTFYERARLFRHHNATTTYEYVDMGFNYRMTDIVAAIAIEQLKKLRKITAARQKIAHYYNRELKGVRGIILPKVAPTSTHVYHQYTMRVTKDFKLSRDKLMDSLTEQSISTRIYYPKPLHMFNFFKQAAKVSGSLRNAEEAANEVLSIPIFPSLTKQEQVYIVKQIKSL